MKKIFISTICILLVSCSFSSTNNQYGGNSNNADISDNETLTIAFASGYESLSPYQDNVSAKQRTANIYEALVGFDQDFRIQPRIALSWGNIDQSTWEFSLRENVKFHNGQKLTAKDVIYSFNKAKESEGLKGILAHIDEVTEENEKIIITTNKPDPTLLNKIQHVYIVPDGYLESNDYKAGKPIGTGAYKFETSSESSITLTRNDDYWGKKPYFKTVNIKTIPGRNDRNNMLLSKEIDILGAVPPQKMEELFDNPSITMHFFPSLTIYFLGFNTAKEIDDKKNPFHEKDIRTAIWKILDRTMLVDDVNDLIQSSYQLISANIFGYNPEYTEKENSLADAKKLMKENGYKHGFKIKLAVTEDLTKSALALKSNFEDLNINTEILFLDANELIDSLKNNEVNMFILGWKFDSGDPDIYLRNFFHTPTKDLTYGSYNFFNFSNKKLDKMIEKQEEEFEVEERLTQLQDIFEEINTHAIAIPLFEPKSVYASQSYIDWEPRTDGLILASEVNKKIL